MIGQVVTDYVHVDDVLHDSGAAASIDHLLGTGLGRRPLIRFLRSDGSWSRLRVERAITELASDHSILLTGRDLDEDGVATDLLSEQTVLLERIARGAPVADTLRSIEHLAVSRVDDCHLVIGYFDPGGEFVSQADDVEADIVGILDRTGIIRPSGTPAAVEPIPSFRHDEGWDSVLRAASGNYYRTAWVCDLVAADGKCSGRLTLLRHQPTPLTMDELDLLGLVADLATLAIERHDLQARLAHSALHDELTGLPNRRFLLSRLREVFATPESKGGLLFLDLDRFKIINDSLGHLVGDQLLVVMSRVLTECLRPGDTVARLGGDEFAVLLENISELKDAVDVADRVHQALATPLIVNGHEIYAAVSIGITLGSERYERPEQVLRDADIAMYQAKGRGGGSSELFDTQMHANILDRIQLEADMHGAVDHKELVLYYQPIIDLKTHRLPSQCAA